MFSRRRRASAAVNPRPPGCRPRRRRNAPEFGDVLRRHKLFLAAHQQAIDACDSRLMAKALPPRHPADAAAELLCSIARPIRSHIAQLKRWQKHAAMRPKPRI